MTPVEILALLVVVLAFVKLVFVLIKPAAWMGLVKKVYGNSLITSIAGLIAAAVILKYLLVELTIVQIFAVMAFIMALMVIGVAAYGKEMIEFAQKFFENRNVIKKSFLSVIIWFVLMGWVLVELFKG